jgi:hypothetical protein
VIIKAIKQSFDHVLALFLNNNMTIGASMWLVGNINGGVTINVAICAVIIDLPDLLFRENVM